MTRNTTGSFFTQLRKKLFRWKVEHEIYDEIMPHLMKEKDHGYPFGNSEEMKAMTEELNVQTLLDVTEGHILNMPEGFGEVFRHVMHRNLYESFLMYEQIARRHVRRPCDPRLIATRFEG